MGSTVRVKDVVEAAQGAGVCAKDDSETRLERKACNTDKCGKEFFNAKDELMHCNAMIDVILILDSSGSIGDKGWEATKTAAEMLLSGFNTGDDAAQIAVLQFSGPTDDKFLNACLDGSTKDFEKDCKLSWLSHWSTDSKALISTVGSAKSMKGTTLTSSALSMAEAEIANGRRDARKVTIVVTDGRPFSLEATKEAALSLREKSRLMFVPVTENAPIADIMEWASTPAVENVIVVKDFEELALKETANRMVADACPALDKFLEQKEKEQ